MRGDAEQLRQVREAAVILQVSVYQPGGVFQRFGECSGGAAGSSAGRHGRATTAYLSTGKTVGRVRRDVIREQRVDTLPTSQQVKRFCDAVPAYVGTPAEERRRVSWLLALYPSVFSMQAKC